MKFEFRAHLCIHLLLQNLVNMLESLAVRSSSAGGISGSCYELLDSCTAWCAALITNTR